MNRVLIVEDEEATAQRTARLIQEIEPSVQIAGMTDSIESSVIWLKSNPHPDLILMDIQLADGSSFEIFKQVTVSCPVIFTTAYDTFALQAFKVNSIDYLLKPLRKNELEAAWQKFSRLNKPAAAIDYLQLAHLLQSKQTKYLQRIMVKVGQQIKVFLTKEVAYFYIFEKIVFAKLNSGERYPIDQSLDQLELELNPEEFFRINRGFIISFNSIDKLHTYSKSRIKVILKPACEEEAISSTERSPLFRAWLSGKEA
jgi:DNA-binding LytR/AlgR family response regulator